MIYWKTKKILKISVKFVDELLVMIGADDHVLCFACRSYDVDKEGTLSNETKL